MNITEFLEARIAEDEARAHLAERWADDGSEPHIRWVGQGRDSLVHRLGKGGPHIAAMSPTRVLAECAAKREILEARKRSDKSAGMDDWAAGWSDGNYHALHTLAAVYKEHPDYLPEWAL